MTFQNLSIKMEGGCIQKRAAITLHVHVKHAWLGIEKKGFENHAGLGMGLGHERQGELGTGMWLEGREKDSISNFSKCME